MPAPPRGTRPRNRRALIVAAAADLFVRKGYPHVAMSDIAAAVAIGPSALYRHFSGKQELLGEVVLDAFTTISAAFEDSDEVFEVLAVAVLDHRGLGVLWQRESRHLAPDVREELQKPLVELAKKLAGKLGDRRPDLTPEQAGLLAWALLAALTSVSFHRVELPRAEYEGLLTMLADDVAGVALPAFAGEPAAPTSIPESRRDRLLATAIRLFAERGYDTVAIEEIAAAEGIAGPSIYHHFASKLDLLRAGMADGAQRLDEGLRKALDEPDPADALRTLSRSYTAYSLAHHHIVDLLITEVAFLPDPERHEVRRTQHDYVTAWAGLLREVHQGLAEGPARVRVQAVLTVVNDVARTPRLRALPGVDGALAALGDALLALPDSGL